jgi:hypothetical protein
MAVTITFLGESSSTSNLTTYTFSGEALGTTAGEIVVVVFGFDDATAFTVSSVTVDGDAAAFITNTRREAGTASLIEMWKVAHPGVSSGNVVVTFSEAVVAAGIAVYKVEGHDSTVAHAANDNGDLNSSIEFDETLDLAGVTDGPIPAGWGYIMGAGARVGTADMLWGSVGSGDVETPNLAEDCDVYINEGSGNDSNFSTASGANAGQISANWQLLIDSTTGTGSIAGAIVFFKPRPSGFSRGYIF